MSYVGDIIMDLRTRIPDAPAVMQPPVIGGVNTLFDPDGILTIGGSFTVYATAVNPWGETLTAGPITVQLSGSDNAFQIQVGTSPQAVGVNIYTLPISPPPLPYQQPQIWRFTATPLLPLGTYEVGTFAEWEYQTLPTRSTAFMPDTDGQFIGAFTAFRLLKRAIDEMVKIAGGIVDVTGVHSVINTSMYRLNAPFYTFVNAWYDGYPMDVVPRSFMYLRNSAAGFSGILSYEQDGPQQVIQVWPQSNRTGGNTILSAPMSATDTSLQLGDGSGFLSIGLVKVDDEVMAFSSASPFPVTTPQPVLLQGVLRGMGGTDIVAHDLDAPVQELNIRLSGYRMAKTYVVGQSQQTISVPQSWETPLVLHMLSQVRSMEQDDATAKALTADFVQMAEKIAKGSRLGRIKPRQIPIWGQNTSDARNVNGIGFGWLIN